MSDLERFEAKFIPEPNTGCWLWSGGTVVTGARGNQRPQVYLNGVREYGHRASYKLYRGPIPRGRYVCHTCDNQMCVNPDHLFLGDHGDNMADMVQKGRSARGAKNRAAKLTEDQVRAIVDDRRVQRVIAMDYGITQAAVSMIQNGKTWGHIAQLGEGK